MRSPEAPIGKPKRRIAALTFTFSYGDPRVPPRIHASNTGSGAKSPFSTGTVSWQPIHDAAIVA